MSQMIFKIVDQNEWYDAHAKGVYTGAPIDQADGFIHFSTLDQVEETAVRHFAGQANLILVAVDTNALGTSLRYEASRGGALFPHLYGALAFSAVLWEQPLPLGKDGHHDFSGLLG